MGNAKSYFFKEFLEWFIAIAGAIIIALLIRAFIFTMVEVKMISMQDTLFEGQRLIQYNLRYHFSPPERGDIVVFTQLEGKMRLIPLSDKSPFLRKLFPAIDDYNLIKRVIGVPGDVIDIKDGYVYINGKKLDEPYIKGRNYDRGMKLPAKVPVNKVFVMGDNREYSSDSRQIGFIDIGRIRGKAVFRIWPLRKFGSIYPKTVP